MDKQSNIFNADVHSITTFDIHTAVPTVYNTLLKDFIIKNCKNIESFVIANLYHLLEKTYWFCYPKNFVTTDEDINNLFVLNKKGIITLSLFNQMPNPDNVYQLQEDISCYEDITPITSYAKKYVSFYIPIWLAVYLRMYIENVKYFNPNIKMFFQNELEYNNVDLTFDTNGTPLITSENIKKIMQLSPEYFCSNVQSALYTNYIGCIIYEESINSTTDIISVLKYFITLT